MWSVTVVLLSVALCYLSSGYSPHISIKSLPLQMFGNYIAPILCPTSLLRLVLTSIDPLVQCKNTYEMNFAGFVMIISTEWKILGHCCGKEGD